MAHEKPFGLRRIIVVFGEVESLCQSSGRNRSCDE